MLGYPKDLVSKGKDLIYRYTVYTPQEEMKRILMEDKDTRLNTLRKVFNIDKYKKIRENVSMFIRSLKEKKREVMGFISDLDEKNREIEFMHKEISTLSEKIEEIVPKTEKARENVKNKRENISAFENKIKELNRLKKNLEVYETEMKNLLDERERNKENIDRVNKQIEEINEELEKEKIKDIKKTKELINSLEKEKNDLKYKLDNAKEKLNEATITKRKAEEIIGKISTIEQCPLCLQNVEHTHKASIKEREDKNIFESEQNIELYSKIGKELKKKIEDSEKELDILRKEENKMEWIKVKIKNLAEKKYDKEKIENRQDQIKKNVGAINTKKLEINKLLEEMKTIEEDYQKAKEEFDLALVEEKKCDIKKTAFEKEKESLNRIIKSLEVEVDKKTKEKEKLTYISEMQIWLDEFFINLMGTMEKHVMLQVHREFNELFKEWFNFLIEDDAISVRLDDEFTPIVEQNGYESNIDNLSGGEKTSVALSYRLALNKVINDVVSGIKTKDILMLDEPTDGFSSEQLDKVRDVLEQLKMKQVVIVSHESKIESYVDKVIKTRTCKCCGLA